MLTRREFEHEVVLEDLAGEQRFSRIVSFMSTFSRTTYHNINHSNVFLPEGCKAVGAMPAEYATCQHFSQDSPDVLDVHASK